MTEETTTAPEITTIVSAVAEAPVEEATLTLEDVDIALRAVETDIVGIKANAMSDTAFAHDLQDFTRKGLTALAEAVTELKTRLDALASRPQTTDAAPTVEFGFDISDVVDRAAGILAARLATASAGTRKPADGMGLDELSNPITS